MSAATTRCIVHVDMDCFYAQVEGVRLGYDCRTQPYALIQWDNFIAVNYPARALGVRRFHDTPDVVRQRYPHVHMSHIATLAPTDTVPTYPENPLIQTHKVSLQPYREASRKIFDILRHSEPGVCVGKAGIDEAFLDVTEAATMELARLQSEGRPLDALEDVLAPETKLIADRSAEMEAFFASRGTTLERVYDAPMRALKRGEAWPEGEGSRSYCVRSGRDSGGGLRAEEVAEAEANCLLLCAATRVVARLRARIYTELHYDCSAGIAHNRLLAKCISAAHKPHQQTLLLPDRGASALFDLPLDKVRGFGGKLGDAVREICGDGAALCRDVWLAPLSAFAALSGDAEDGDNSGEAPAPSKTSRSGYMGLTSSSGASVFFRLRGFSGDAVADPGIPSAVEAGKVFHPACTSLEAAHQWMTALTADLADRYSDYAPVLSSRGRLLTVRLTPYPRRAVLKSRPRLLPEDDACLSATTLREHATTALRELLESTLPHAIGEDGESRPTRDNALPLHQIYVSVSALHPLQADPLRHTPTLKSLFSSVAATRQTHITTTESFFTAPRQKRQRAESDVDGGDDSAATDATTGDRTAASRPRGHRMSADGETHMSRNDRTVTLDAFCRVPARPQEVRPASVQDNDIIVLSPDVEDVMRSSPSASVQSVPLSPAPRLLTDSFVDLTDSPHTSSTHLAGEAYATWHVIEDEEDADEV